MLGAAHRAGSDLTADAGRRGAWRRSSPGSATPAQIAGFIVALRMKGETVEELAGLLDAMLGRVRAGASSTVADAGRHRAAPAATGSHSINVSTLAALVVAGAGGRVCKHGNRAASSSCGSADLLEALGVVIELGPEGVARCVARGRHRLLLRAALPPGDAPRRADPPRARRADRVQLPRPAGQPGPGPPPGRRA